MNGGTRAKATASLMTHVSDTALWVASIRASEARRADAAFNDPLADMLAGERGRHIARAIPRAAVTAWGVIVRTTTIDRLIQESLSDGIDTVLNLGAGMDARPYRMNLPPQLRWIEVDFPAIVELKNATLRRHQPVCRLERIGMNLLERPARQALLAANGAVSKSTLVLTEGVISYLSPPDAATLADDLYRSTAIGHWLQDFDNAGRRAMPRRWARKLQAAPFLFDVEDWFKFFEAYGWLAARSITTLEESARINRPYPDTFPYGLLMKAIPNDMRKKILSLSGAVLMRKKSLPIPPTW